MNITSCEENDIKEQKQKKKKTRCAFFCKDLEFTTYSCGPKGTHILKLSRDGKGNLYWLVSSRDYP